MKKNAEFLAAFIKEQTGIALKVAEGDGEEVHFSHLRELIITFTICLHPMGSTIILVGVEMCLTVITLLCRSLFLIV